MTDEERAISDKLDSYMKDVIEIHITLKRTLADGRNVWLNGYVANKLSGRVWELRERVLGKIRIAISEIKDIEVAE